MRRADLRLRGGRGAGRVDRDADGVVVRVTFTSEVPEYFEHLATQDPDRLLTLYRELVGPQVRLDELVVGGRYRKDKRAQPVDRGPARPPRAAEQHAGGSDEAGRPGHGAAPRPAGPAGGEPQALVSCGGLGEPLRNSDPQIAAAVNDAAATGAEVTLQDPFGLYLDGLLTPGMRTPDGEDPAAFWVVERGTPEHTLRASFSVPPERGYRVGDITADGVPIRFGAQVADRVGVRLTALVVPSDHRPRRQPCVS